MANNRCAYFFTWLLIIATCVTGHCTFKQYTTANGLVSNTIYYIFRDSKGYLWFGTDKGVSVFDGLNFKNYTISDGLGDNEVFRIFEDKKGRIWPGTYNGSVCYFQNGKIFNSGNDSLVRKMPAIPFMNAMCFRGDSDIYIGYVPGQLIVVHNHEVKWINRTPGGKYSNISEMYMSDSGLNIIADSSRIIIRQSKIDTYAHGYFQRGFYNNGRLMISDSEGVKIYNSRTLLWRCDNKTLTSSNLIYLLHDNSILFCGCRDGLYIINFKTGKWIRELPDMKITCITKDIEGNYWISSLENGVFCLSKGFEDIHLVKQVEQGQIYTTKNGAVLFKNADTLYEFDGQAMKRIDIRLHPKVEPLYNDAAFLFYKDHYYTWRINKRTNKTDSGKMGLKFIFPYHSDQFIFLDPHALLYVKKADHWPRTIDSLHFDGRLLDAEIDTSFGKVYLLFQNALYQYNISIHTLSTVDSFHGALAVGISKVNDKIIVTLTNGRFNLYNVAGNNAKQVFAPQGTVYYSFRDIGHNTLLLNSSKGYLLQRDFDGDFSNIRPQKIEYPFRHSDLLAIYPYDTELLCDVNNSLYFVSKTLLNKELGRPVLYIGKIVVNNRSYDSNRISLYHMDNCNLNIYFNPLSFNNLKNHYEYRISNNNIISEWFKNDGTVANILLSGYGEHLVEVKAVTENDIASPIQTIHVILHPPFYRSWWFMVTMTIAALVIVFFSFILYTGRRKKIFEHELEFMQLEHKAINSLLDPHFTFNAINNIQNVIVSGDLENANEYLAILSRLIRQNMENLQFSFIPLEKELKLIEHYVYLQNLRFGDKITLHVTRQNVDADEVSIPPLLIHTFVENAIVHGFIKDTPLHIGIELLISEEKYLQIIVADDGRGFKAKKEDTSDKLSLGIDFMRKRLERMSKFYGVFYSLNITSLEVTGSRGTEVTIIVYAQMEHRNKKR